VPVAQVSHFMRKDCFNFLGEKVFHKARGEEYVTKSGDKSQDGSRAGSASTHGPYEDFFATYIGAFEEIFDQVP